MRSDMGLQNQRLVVFDGERLKPKRSTRMRSGQRDSASQSGVALQGAGIFKLQRW